MRSPSKRTHHPRIGRLSRELLPAGKVPLPLLKTLLARFARSRDPRVIVGAGVGLDAAAIDMGDRCLVAKTDPITFVTEEIGTYALAINANDLATMGAIPRWFLATLLLPAGATAPTDVGRIFAQLHAACRKLRVSLCGGHTEVTDAVRRPVVVGCLLGESPKGRLITTADARVGDVVLLTKGIPIEAVSILARERADELKKRYPARFVARCRRYLADPGVSIIEEARIALAVGGIHAMHDPTEGGLSSALYELAEAAGVGLRIDERAIRVLPEGARLCADFGLNPLGAIASGALLISADPTYEQRLLVRFHRSGIPAACIGRVMTARHGVHLVGKGGGTRPLPRFAMDEIARFLSSASKT